MKSRHPIDDLFRDRLAQQPSEFPEHLWAGIEKQLNPPPRRSLLLPLWGGLGMVLLAGLAIIFWPTAKNTTPNTSVKVQDVPTTPTTQPTKAITAQAPMAVDVDAPATASSSAQASNALPTPTTTKTSTTASAKTSTTKTPVSTPTTIHNTIETTYTPALAVSDAPLPQPATVVPTPPVLAEVTTEALTEQQASAQAVPTNSTTRQLDLPADIDGLSALVDYEPETSLGVKPFVPKLVEPTRCAKFAGTQWRFYASPAIAPDFATRTLDHNGSAAIDYTEKRYQTELTRPGFSTGVHLSAVTGHGLSLRSGVQFHQINEEFSLVNTKETIVITYNAQGQPVSRDTTTTTSAEYSKNRYRSYSVPLHLGYNFKYKDLQFSLNGGAEFHFDFKQKGTLVDPNDFTRSLDFNSTEVNAMSPFREQLGIAWYGSLGIYYPLSRELSLRVEPYVRSYSKSFTNDNFLTEQRYMVTGIWLGLRKQL